jgi:hypothetical protein
MNIYNSGMNPYLTHPNPRTQELVEQAMQLTDDEARLAWMQALSEEDRALMRAWAEDVGERLTAVWHIIQKALAPVHEALLDWARSNQKLFAAFAEKDRDT